MRDAKLEPARKRAWAGSSCLSIGLNKNCEVIEIKFAVVLCLLLVAFSAWAGTFRDDFEDGNLTGWRQIWWKAPGNWNIENGQLVLNRDHDWVTYQTLADIIVDDVTIEFDAQIEQLFRNYAAIELGLRTQDTDHTAYFSIGRWNNRWIAIGALWWMGRFENWHEVPFPFEMGRWYHFKGIVQGNKFTLFIDGKKILTFNEGRLVKGKVGFGAAGCKARFDNVVITGDGVPDVGPSGYAIQRKALLATTWGKIRCALEIEF